MFSIFEKVSSRSLRRLSYKFVDGSHNHVNGRRCFSVVSSKSWVDWDENHVASSKMKDIPRHDLGLSFPEFIMKDFAKHGEKIAIVDGTSGEKRTFGDLTRHVDSIGLGLKETYGIGKGDVVALMSPNHADYFSCVNSCMKIGASVTVINPIYTFHEVSKQLLDCDAKLIIAHSDNLSTAQEAAKAKSEASGVECKAITIQDEVDELKSTAGVLHAADIDVVNDTALLPYSSGTTGLPKGVMLTHENLVSNILQSVEGELKFYSPDDVTLSPLPMFHIYSFLVSLHLPLFSGTPLITMKAFDMELFCKLVEEYKATRMHIVPPIVLGLAKHPIVDKYDMSSLQVGISAAAPLGGDIERAMSKRLNCSLKQAWGMSELSPIGTLNPDCTPKSGTVGPPVSNTQAKITCLETGANLPPGGSGELHIRGPQVMKGYLGQREKTEECLSADGWLKTGDIASIDEDGYVTIEDRAKELIKVLGFQVAPAELEALLITHPDIIDSCVIPVLDDKTGEIPRAYVVLKPESVGKVSEEEICQFVEERVAKYKRLGAGVVFCDAIAKTASGKILRREMVARDRGA